MPFAKQTEKLLAGSLNLLPAGDMVPVGDSLQLQNWRVDQAGGLVSRKGLQLETGVLAGAWSTLTMARFGLDRYACLNGQLRQGTSLATVVDSGYDVGAFASMAGATWVMDRYKQTYVVGSTASQWGIDAPFWAPDVTAWSATAGLVGTFYYFVTFGNDLGHESNPSPVSAGIEFTMPGGTLLTNIPVSPDPQVDRRHIYRVGGSVQSPQRVTTIYENSSITSWEDTVSVDAQQNLNIAMPSDHNRPPSCYGLMGPYFGRLIAFRSVAFPGRYWWSKTALPSYWPGAADESEGNWQDAGDVREAILAGRYRNRLALFYKEKSIWRLDGDPDTNDPEDTNAGVGIIGSFALASDGGVDYFVGPEGVYQFNGDRTVKISARLDPIFKGEYVKVGDVYLPPLNQAFSHNVVMAARFGRLYLSYPSGGESVPDTTLVCDLESGRWYSHKISTDLIAPTMSGGYVSGFIGLLNEGTGGALLGGLATPSGVKVAAIEQGQTDAGAPIELIWQSRFSDQAKPDNEKVYQDLVLDYSTWDQGEAAAAAALTVKAIYNNGANVETLGTIAASTRSRKTFTLGTYPGKMAYNIALRVEGDASSTVRINEATLNYYLEPRRARNWDSGWLDFGTREVKDLLAVEIDIEGDGVVTLELHNDYLSMSQAASGTFAGILPRRRVYLQAETVPYTLYTAQSKPIPGRRFRIALSTTEGKYMKVYSMRAKIRLIAKQLDSSDGARWVTDPMMLGN